MQAVDERGQSQRIGQQDEFLPLWRTHLARRGHEFDALDPFRRGQIDLAGEGMEVLHRRCHDHLQARIGRRRHLVEHGVRDRFRRQLTHASLPGMPAVFRAAGRYCSKPNRLLGISTRRSRAVPGASYKLIVAHLRIRSRRRRHERHGFCNCTIGDAARLFLANRRRDLLSRCRWQHGLGACLLRVRVGTGRLRRNIRGPLTGRGRLGRC